MKAAAVLAAMCKSSCSERQQPGTIME